MVQGTSRQHLALFRVEVEEKRVTEKYMLQGPAMHGLHAQGGYTRIQGGAGHTRHMGTQARLGNRNVRSVVLSQAQA